MTATVAAARLVEASPWSPSSTESSERRGRLGRLSPMAAAVVETIAYADVFDWPAAPAEIHRYLPLAATRSDVDAVIASGELDGFVERQAGLVTLRGRSALIRARQRREVLARALWPSAIRYARAVAALPFVRMVAVTGSLAVDSTDAHEDVDLLVVTADDRLWLSRAMAMVVVRGAGLGHVRLCPNYLLAESALEIADRSLFAARELMQMVPIAGGATYRELLQRNAWVHDWLPNATLRSPARRASGRASAIARRCLEGALGGSIGAAIERWEMDRKVRRLTAESQSAETRYDRWVCKGHTEEHRHRVLAAYDARLRGFEETA